MSSATTTILTPGSLPDLATRVNAAHQSATRAANDTIQHAREAGLALLDAKRECGHGQFIEWVEANCECTPRTAQNYMKVAAEWDRIESKTKRDSHLSVREALRLIDDNVMNRSDSAEWYTPQTVVDRVVDVLGEIDLDPCANSHACPTIPAALRHTKEDDGLSQPWSGRVYLNPPYGRVIDGWIEKLVSSYSAGDVTEAIALVPARVDTAWFRRLRTFPRSFLFGRLTFSNSENPAPFPTAVVYLGRNVDRFAEVFGGEVGDVFELRRAAS